MTEEKRKESPKSEQKPESLEPEFSLEPSTIIIKHLNLRKITKK